MEQLALFAEKPKKAPPRVTVGRFIMLGAGVQSSALVEMMVEGEIARVDGVIFADTGNEPPWVYEQAKYLQGRCEAAGVPFFTVAKQGKGIVNDVREGHDKFLRLPLFTLNPKTGERGRISRQCTRDYKITPANSAMLEWLIERGYGYRRSDGRRFARADAQVEILYGISADEAWRRKNPKHAKNWQIASYPLVDNGVTRKGCVEWLESKGLPVPMKSSCVICPYHRNDYWQELKEKHPALFEEACAFDDWLRTPEYKQRYRAQRHERVVQVSVVPQREIDFLNPPRRERLRRGRDAISPFQIELIEGASCASDGGFSCFS